MHAYEDSASNSEPEHECRVSSLRPPASMQPTGTLRGSFLPRSVCAGEGNEQDEMSAALTEASSFYSSVL